MEDQITLPFLGVMEQAMSILVVKKGSSSSLLWSNNNINVLNQSPLFVDVNKRTHS
jgi:hypothetical protein